MYGKIFESMYDGSLCGEWEAIVTFQQMIVLADEFGIIDMTPKAISKRTSVPIEIIKKGIFVLESPDPDSRTPGNNGKRIKKINPERKWGWEIVNYEIYRKMYSRIDRRKYMKEYMRKYRKQT